MMILDKPVKQKTPARMGVQTGDNTLLFSQENCHQ